MKLFEITYDCDKIKNRLFILFISHYNQYVEKLKDNSLI